MDRETRDGFWTEDYGGSNWKQILSLSFMSDITPLPLEQTIGFNGLVILLIYSYFIFHFLASSSYISSIVICFYIHLLIDLYSINFFLEII